MDKINKTLVVTTDGDQFRWRLTSWNGKIIAASTESYKQRKGALRNAELVLQYKSRGDIVLHNAEA